MYILAICFILILLIVLLIVCKTNVIERYTLSKIDSSIMRYIFDSIFPPGYVIISMGNAFDPSTVSWLSHTTWEAIPDGLILTACSDDNTAEIVNEDNPILEGILTTGKTKLTTAQIPSHSHGITLASSGAHTHEVTYNINFNDMNELDTEDSTATCVVSKSTETVDTGTTSVPHQHDNSSLLFNIRLGDQTSHSHKCYLPISYAHIYYRTSSERASLKVSIDKNTIRDSILNYVFPVGSVILTTNKTSPSEYGGGDLMPGTWASLNVDALLAASYDFSGSVEDSDGSFTSTESHELEADELPQHTHSASISYYSTTHTHTAPNQVEATMDNDWTDTGGTDAYVYTDSSNDTYTTSKAGDHTHTAEVVASCGNETTGAAEGHTHALNLPLFKVYVYQRTD